MISIGGQSLIVQISIFPLRLCFEKEIDASIKFLTQRYSAVDIFLYESALNDIQLLNF